MSDTTASGRFVLRIPGALHAELREAAAAADLSLNEYCRRVLAAHGAARAAGAGGDAVVRRAIDLLGVALCGIVVYGSWARGEQAAGSDTDVLVVLSPDHPVTRDLYRRWDTLGPLYWDGYRVEPHFVHIPAAGARVTATWAEAAVEGVVIHDPGFRVSKRLVELRGRIAAGELTRRWAHGQPYWVEAA